MPYNNDLDLGAGFGLYLHVPYCKALCHYCDFAKTANYTDEQASAYLAQLGAHLEAWLAEPAAKARLGAGFTSVFLGGGTPSLFAGEYAGLFARLRPQLQPGCEVSLEANPDDITAERLALWRELGVTRLSIGVQTFDADGLTRLKRVHDAGVAQRAIELARAPFPDLNVDLIYGWPGQELAGWERDLRLVLGLGVRHLSLYTLTYEPRTPLGRAALRGRVVPQTDDRAAAFYELACRLLAAAGFEHEEVSNWAQPGASCRHNWLYWQDGSYLGVGTGAHGYLADPEGPGLRYAYPRNERAFIRHQVVPASLDSSALAGRYGVTVELERALDDWLTELVGSSLRTRRGFPLREALARGGWRFEPTPLLAAGLEKGVIRLDGTGSLVLPPAEWFREVAWAVEILRSAKR